MLIHKCWESRGRWVQGGTGYLPKCVWLVMDPGSVLIPNVETVLLEMDPGSVLIHVDVAFALLEPCPVLTKRALDIRQNVVCLCLDLECVNPECRGCCVGHGSGVRVDPWKCPVPVLTSRVGLVVFCGNNKIITVMKLKILKE